MGKASNNNQVPNLDLDDDDDDDENAAVGHKSRKADRNYTPSVFAEAALNQALTRKTRALLKRDGGIYILRLPHENWAKPFGRVARNLGSMLITRAVTSLEKIGGSYRRAGAGGLEIAQRGFGVVFITQSPETLLDEAVLAAADATISIAAPTPALLRKVIGKVTGGVARGVTAQMAELDLAVILSVIRPDLTARQCVDNLQRAVDRQPVPDATTVPLLTQLPMTEFVRTWSSQTLADLSAVKAGRLPPSAIEFAMLEGPPGTGKTLIAESLAETAGWNLVPATIGGWFTVGDGALGGVAKNLRAFIDKVIAAEPCIAFLDEIDALPSRDSLDERSRDWWTPIITLFLTEIDRLKKSGRKVMLIGASNYYTRLDPALIRPGRLRQRVSVQPPSSEAEAMALLRYYLSADLDDAEIKKLVRFAIGATPAMVEGWTKSGRALARASHRNLVLDDVLAQVVPPDCRSPEDLRAISCHEVGHALVAHRLGHRIESVTIVPNGAFGGSTTSIPATSIPTRRDIEDLVTIALAGRAADIVIGGGPNAGASGDLAAATDLLVRAQDSLGLRGDLVHASLAHLRPGLSREALGQELDRLLERAKSIILDDINIARQLIDQLITDKTLTGSEIAAFLDASAPSLDVTVTCARVAVTGEPVSSGSPSPTMMMDPLTSPL